MAFIAQIVRITLFLPNADRVSQLVNSYVLDDHGVLHYRDLEGVEYQTTNPPRNRAPRRRAARKRPSAARIGQLTHLDRQHSSCTAYFCVRSMLVTGFN